MNTSSHLPHPEMAQKNNGICIPTLAWRCVEVLVDKDQSLLPCRTGAVPVLVPPRFVSYFLRCSLLVCKNKFFGEVEKTHNLVLVCVLQIHNSRNSKANTTCHHHLPGPLFRKSGTASEAWMPEHPALPIPREMPHEMSPEGSGDGEGLPNAGDHMTELCRKLALEVGVCLKLT